MKSLGGLIGAVVGGALGAVIWAAVTYYTGWEIGWIAWAIGGLTGAGTLIGLHLSGGKPSEGIAVLASVVALLAIIGGKFAASEIDLRNEIKGGTELVLSCVADDVVWEHMQAGEKIAWPRGVDPNYASERKDYPPDLWREATGRWGAMTLDEQAAYVRDVRSFYRMPVFWRTFSPFDLIWLLLALATAWRIAALETD